MLTSSGGRSMLTVADRGRGVKFAKILLTSYVNAPLNKLMALITLSKQLSQRVRCPCSEIVQISPYRILYELLLLGLV